MAAFRFVFVHGAWHGAWCFDLIRHELQRRAIQCDSVDLPSMGDDATPVESATFDAGVERVLGQIGTRRNTILVAHSLGALYATEAAIRSTTRVRSVIYVASYVPMPGDEYRTLNEMAPVSDEVQSLVTRTDDALEIDTSKVADVFYQDVPEGIDQAAATRLKPQPLAPMKQAVISDPNDVLKKITRRAIVAGQDRVLSPDDCVKMAERASLEIESIPSGHCPFLSMPRLLVDILLGVE